VSDRAAIAAVAGSQLRRRWRSLVVLGLLAGLIGGAATAAVAGARRSSTAYDRLVEATAFPDAFIQLIEPGPGLIERVGASPAVERSVPAIFAVGRDAAQRNQVLLPVQAAAEPFTDLLVVRGRAPDPAAADEVTMSESLAEALGVSVGDVFAYDGLTRDEFEDLFEDRWDGSASGLRIDLRIVGITRFPTDAVLGDFPTLIGTPALLERFGADLPDAYALWVDLRDGATADDLRRDLSGEPGPGGGGTAPTVEVLDLRAERTILDDAVAVLVWGLLAFGAVTLVAGVVVLGQVVGRFGELARSERTVLRDLGIDRRAGLLATTASAGLAVAVAAVCTVAVAIVGSRWTPIGAARSVEPSPGTAVNVVLVAAGASVMAAILAGLFLLTTMRVRASAPPGTRRVGRAAGLASDVLRAGPVGSVAATSAFGAGRRVATSRIAFAGVVAGVGGVVAASIFGASLDDLTGEPGRWGAVGEHLVEVPEPVRDRTYDVLDTAADVDAYAVLGGSSAEIDDRGRVDAYRFEARKGDIAPVVLSGSLPVTEGEVALGPSLLADLGVEVGERIDVDGEAARVVGTVLTFGLSDRSSATEGVLLGGAGRTPPDFTTLVVRYSDGVDAMQAADRLYGDLEYFTPSRPADVTNLAALRPLPPLLVVLLALVGAAALLHVGLGIGTRGRHDLSVLRALGFSPGHAIRVVTVATALVAVAASVIGVPLGVVSGRAAWTAVAATTSLARIVRFPPALLLGVPGLALLTLVAGLWSGRRAVRRPVPEVLRAE
jgi:putative ABC transport system permease protein